MKAANNIIDEHRHALKRDFDAFYPTGHLVVGFQKRPWLSPRKFTADKLQI